MPLTGTFSRTLDEKQRLALPKPVREDVLGDSGDVFVTPEPDGSLGIYAATVFEDRAERLSEHSADPRLIRQFLRLYYSQAERVSADGQGRVRIPERLIEHAQLTSEVTVLGVRDHLEVWSQVAWQTMLDQLKPEFDRLAEASLRPSG